MAKRLRKIRIREVSLVDKGAGKGVQVQLFKRAPQTDDGAAAFDFRVPFEKVDADKRQVFGWAYVSKAAGSDEEIVDYDDHIIDTEDLEQGAYEFMLSSRKGGEMHERADRKDPGTVYEKSRCIESFVTTPEKQAAMGLAGLPVGWWVGFAVDDEETWQKVRKGELQEFSIAGLAVEEDVEKTDKREGGRMTTALAKLKGFLGFAKSGGMDAEHLPQTVGQILDNQRMRKESFELSDALMSSVCDITYSREIDGPTRIDLLKKTVDEFGVRMSTVLESLGTIEKAYVKKAVQTADQVIEALQADSMETAQAVIEKARPRAGQNNAPSEGDKENEMKIEEFLKSLTPEQKAEFVKALAAPEAPAAPVVDVEKSLPEAARAEFAKLRETNVVLEKRVTDLVDRLNRAEDEKSTRECVEMAKRFTSLGVPDADLAATFKSLKGTPAMDVYVKSLETALAKVAAAERTLTSTRGRTATVSADADGSAYAVLEKKAKAMATESSISFEKAMRTVVSAEPELYRRHLKEEKAKSRAEMFDEPMDGAAS